MKHGVAIRSLAEPTGMDVAAEVRLAPGGHTELASTRPALFVVGTGVARARVNLRSELVRPGEVVGCAPADVLILDSSSGIAGWWLEIDPRSASRAAASEPEDALAEALEHRRWPTARRIADRLTQRLNRQPLAQTRMGRIKLRALDQLDGRLTLTELAKLAGHSRFYLIRTFRRRFGTTPRAFHLALRMSEARRRLVAGAPAVQVAHDLGFSDQSHFHRRFVEAHGTTPRAFALGAEAIRCLAC
jgi:AraC-like DNA-binding protein